MQNVACGEKLIWSRTFPGWNMVVTASCFSSAGTEIGSELMGRCGPFPVVPSQLGFPPVMVLWYHYWWKARRPFFRATSLGVRLKTQKTMTDWLGAIIWPNICENSLRATDWQECSIWLPSPPMLCLCCTMFWTLRLSKYTSTPPTRARTQL